MTNTKPTAIGALVLAGARHAGDPLCAQEGVASKAVLDIGGKPMITHVLDALNMANIEGDTWVLGGDQTTLAPALSGHDVAHLEASGAGPAASLCAALDGPVGPPLLVTTADHPLLSAEIITHFVTAAQSSGADLCVGFARRGVIETNFPDTRRTYLPIGARDLSSCNLFYVANPTAKRVLDLWQTVESERKHPWRMARRLGLWFLFRLFLMRRSEAQVFSLLSKRLGAYVQPVILPFADAAVDVDTLDDLTLMRGIFERRR